MTTPAPIDYLDGISQEDMDTVNRLSANYALEFKYLGVREKWYFIDVLYVGRWQYLDNKISTYSPIFFCNKHGTHRMYNSTRAMQLDRCTENGRWKL